MCAFRRVSRCFLYAIIFTRKPANRTTTRVWFRHRVPGPVPYKFAMQIQYRNPHQRRARFSVYRILCIIYDRTSTELYRPGAPGRDGPSKGTGKVYTRRLLSVFFFLLGFSCTVSNSNKNRSRTPRAGRCALGGRPARENIENNNRPNDSGGSVLRAETKGKQFPIEKLSLRRYVMYEFTLGESYYERKYYFSTQPYY